MILSTPTALVAAAPTLLRQGLVATLREQWPQLQLTLTADATQLVELVGHYAFSLLVLDEQLPGRNLPELLSRLQRARPGLRSVVLTDHQLPALPPAGPGQPLQLSRQVLPHALVGALAQWLDAPTSPAGTSRSPRACAVPDPFSRRELEVLRLVVADHCNEEIANCLCLSVRTVESHRRMLLQKAGTRTLVGLAARAVREGWVA
ncbi:LuxR C-terminal-related transcriptional regulator [Hymenobacter artigasi]|uniref:DNA-binding NarL/FixJ family response regulator n=1 Tax=Hymenobacter artigasi TaxID=2719616 RepID=A0ABX1HDY1_9BACT|nr:response regulator transcription factor [Hymenobacter artigasi]NKI88090.1 DNA-binding NarL/FixJ family response regulator [Hymenobacter artigasi]